VQIRTSEGLERWPRSNHSLLYEGGEWTTDVVIVHDVTRIRQAERAKTDFVATVSHELPTSSTGCSRSSTGRGPDDHDHRRHRPGPVHRPRAGPGDGGEIEATGAPRRGSTFTVRLPLARRAGNPLCRCS
jgi:hypothetical protein